MAPEANQTPTVAPPPQDLVGVIAPNTASFKRELLLFDRLACVLDSEVEADLMPNPQHWRDFNYLLDRGDVFRVQQLIFDGDPQRNASEDHVRFLKLFRERKPSAFGDAFLRMIAAELRLASGHHAVPVLRDWGPIDAPTDRSTIVQLVLHQVPMPSEGHSIEDIRAFRDEMKKEGLITGLRVWMSEMASAKVTHLEASDKLADLLFRFDHALELEKMSRTTTGIETVIVTTAEVAEYLVKVKWSKAAKKLFEVRHRRIELMKAEMDLQGREIAFISRARERFGK